jgi:hypothetical protein
MTIKEQRKARAEKAYEQVLLPQTLGFDENQISIIRRNAYTKGGEDMLPVMEDVAIQYGEFIAKGVTNRDFGFIPEWNRWRMYNVQRITDTPALWLPEQLYQHFITNVYKPADNE